MHPVLPTTEVWPAGHAVHVNKPDDAAYEPDGHFEQADVPVEAAYWPAPQLAQLKSPDEALRPAAQTVQAE